MTNFDLEVRRIYAEACALPGVEYVLADTRVAVGVLDEDTWLWFWRQVERRFDIAVTRAQRQTLTTIGAVVHYLKIRERGKTR